MRPILIVSLLLLLALPSPGQNLEFVEIGPDNRSFVLAESGQPFVPWDFNYDHDRDGRLIEDYWDDEWSTIREDFREMERLGANVVRIHLQFGKFMDAPDRPNAHSLDQLDRLVRLAERTGLYLDLTGLGCYHKADVPAWYDQLNEEDRWNAQARFWSAIARRCADSPAVFFYDFYDLMNEPVVPGGDKKQENWLGPAFGDKHFVQFITRDRAGRVRATIAREWIQTLVAAIREHDGRHLISVGLVPWSLDPPRLSSGFVPERIAGDVDFLCVHLYPEAGKIEGALETLRGFDVGKPVVIEETFPLKCSPEELAEFLDRSRDHAAGWLGFYWGTTPEEYRPAKTIGEALTLGWLELFQERAQSIAE